MTFSRKHPIPPAVPHPPATTPSRPDDWSDALSAAPFDPRRRAHWLVHVGSPLGISLLFHLLIIAVFAGITWAVVQRGGDEEPIEVEARIIAEGPAAGPAGGFQFPDATAVNRAGEGRFAPDAPQATSLAELARMSPQAATPVMPAGNAALPDGLRDVTLGRSDVIGAGGGGVLGAAGSGVGLGNGDAAGGGPIGSLWGVGEGTRARTVAYVVDRSGSFVEWVEAIDLELKRSLGVLADDQQFNLIFLRDDKPLPFRGKLVPATEQAKREAFAWINTYPPAGGSNLTPSVKMALAYKPDVLFMVVDSELFTAPLADGLTVTDRRELLATIRLARRRKNTTVHVILMGPTEMPTVGDRDGLRRQLDALGDANDEKAEMTRSRLMEQIELLSTIEELRKLPAESGGTLRYLNGDALMAEWRASHGQPR